MLDHVQTLTQGWAAIAEAIFPGGNWISYDVAETSLEHVTP